jgi:hypothetical protein
MENLLRSILSSELFCSTLIAIVNNACATDVNPSGWIPPHVRKLSEQGDPKDPVASSGHEGVQTRAGTLAHRELAAEIQL